MIAADAAALMATSSFLDRLRGTGPLTPARARQHGALGPIGKAAGFADDDRLARPYDAYRWLGLEPGLGRYLYLSTATLSKLGYDHNPGEPVIRLWNDDRHVCEDRVCEDKDKA